MSDLFTSFINFFEDSKTIVLTASAIITLFTAWRIIKNQRDIARRQTTVKMLMANMWDKDCIQVTQQFADYANKRGMLVEIYNKYKDIERLQAQDGIELTKEQEKEYKTLAQKMDIILLALNNYELIAIGIREDVYDEQIFKRWYRSTAIDHWIKSKAFMELSKGLGTDQHRELAFCEYDDLMKKWREEGPLPRKTYFYKFFGWLISVRSSR